MWIDTHAHVDAWPPAQATALLAAARAQGVGGIVIPAVAPANFAAVQALAQQSGA